MTRTLGLGSHEQLGGLGASLIVARGIGERDRTDQSGEPRKKKATFKFGNGEFEHVWPSCSWG